MHGILIYLLIFFSIFSSIYLINILRFIIGMNKSNINSQNNNQLIPISIIIAVKNGEKSINRMLSNLLDQTYNGEMEFIIVDDNSTDDTEKIIKDYSLNDPRFKYATSKEGSISLNHKKKALDSGIKLAQHEYLLFTDIDCIVQSNWVSSMAKCFSDNVDYIVGHTYVEDRKTILNKFQRVDLFMLLFAAKSTISLGAPWASAGQNQAYRKTLYNQLNGFQSISSYLQGDDTLFLQLALKHGAKVIFNDNPDSYIISRTESNWKNLLLQRGRWSGDANIMWRFNMNFYLTAISTWTTSIAIIGLILSISTNYLNFMPWLEYSLFIILLFNDNDSFLIPENKGICLPIASTVVLNSNSSDKLLYSNCIPKDSSTNTATFTNRLVYEN